MDGRGVWRGMDICIIWLSPFAVHLKLLQHCSLAILQHKIKSLKKIRKKEDCIALEENLPECLEKHQHLRVGQEKTSKGDSVSGKSLKA